MTKSGTNDFKGTAYMYTTNSHLRGNKVSDYELNRLQSHSTTWGASFGGPIIKDKLFFFVNGEYQSNISAGPSGTARVMLLMSGLHHQVLFIAHCRAIWTICSAS